MAVQGVEGMSVDEVRSEVAVGGRFVVYQFAVSVLILTLYRSTDVRLVRSGDNAVVKGLPWSLLTLVVGWWGFPWGPIRTIQALAVNFGGGRDVTPQIMAALRTPPPPGAAPAPPVRSVAGSTPSVVPSSLPDGSPLVVGSFRLQASWDPGL